jgi:tetratricopeptide (TPR) repeat protein
MPTVEDDGCEPIGELPPCPPCDLTDQPELLATILDAIGIAFLNRGCTPEARTFIERAFEIRLQHFGKAHPATAASHNSRARLLRVEDELLAAEKEVAKAIDINQRVFGRKSLALAMNMNELGAIQLYQGDFKGAARSAERGLGILAKLGIAGTDPNLTRLLDVQGRALEGLGKLRAAATVLNRAVRIDAKQVGVDHPKYATHRANLATIEWAQGNLDLARQGFEQAIAVYEQVMSRPAHPNVIDAHANLGSVLIKLGDLQSAKDHLCRAVGLDRQLRGPGHTLVGNDHANLGRLYFAMGDKQRARAQFGRALGIYQANVKARRLPKTHPYITEAKVWLKRTAEKGRQ